MRIPLPLRASARLRPATLVFSLGLSPSYARMGGSAAGRSLARLLGAVIFRILRRAGSTAASTSIVSVNRFGPGRFDHFGFNRFGLNRFNRFGFNRFNRFGSNRFDRNRLLIGGGGWGWGGWGGFAASTAASEPIIVGDGAPVIINIGVDPVQATPGPPIVKAASSTSSTTTATANMSASVRSRTADRGGSGWAARAGTLRVRLSSLALGSAER